MSKHVFKEILSSHEAFTKKLARDLETISRRTDRPREGALGDSEEWLERVKARLSATIESRRRMLRRYDDEIQKMKEQIQRRERDIQKQKKAIEREIAARRRAQSKTKSAAGRGGRAKQDAS